LARVALLRCGWCSGYRGRNAWGFATAILQDGLAHAEFVNSWSELPAAALTVAKETALGTPLRHYLGTTWGADIEAVKSGKTKLEETSLWPRLSPVPHHLIRFWGSGAEFLKRPA